MTRIGLDRRGKSLPCGFGLSRNVLWTLNKIWKQWQESFCIFICGKIVLDCEKIISQLGKNIFPVGAIWFCSWDLVFRQLLHEYTAWICVVSLRSGVLENQALLSQVSSTRPLRGKKLLSSTPEGYRNFYKQHALKGQKLLAQGSALGYHVRKFVAL